MKVIIYNKRAYREYTLTSYLNHADKRLLLDADLYWIEENVFLLLERSEGEWSLRADESYRIFAKGSDTAVADNVLLSDDLFLTLETLEGERLSIYVVASEDSFCPSAKYELLDNTALLTVGTGEDNDICYFPPKVFTSDMDAGYARIDIRDGEIAVSSLCNEGVYINGEAVLGEKSIEPGDVLQIYGLLVLFIMTQEEILFAIHVSYGDLKVSCRSLIENEVLRKTPENKVVTNGDQTEIFRRSPRQLEVIESGKIVIEEPPSPDHAKPQGLMQTIGNSLLMVLPMITGCAMMLAASRLSGYGTSLFMYSGLVMALTSAVTGVIWGVSNLRAQKKNLVDEENRRFLAYGQYLIRKRDEIAVKYEGNIKALSTNYPSISEVAEYNRMSPFLWDRNEQHEDFLKIRIGLGDIPFQVKIEVPREKFEIYDDELRDKPDYIRKNFETLYDVPQILSLREHRIIGIVGGEEKFGAYELARAMTVRLAATHCYTDVKMAFLYDENSVSDKKQWEFAKLLPHTWSENRKIRYVASTPAEISEVCYSLAGIFRNRLDEADKNTSYRPHYVLFISDSSIVEGELIENYIFNNPERVGVTTVFLSEIYEDLPNSCDCFIENTENFTGIDNKSVGGDRLSVKFDEISLSKAESFARGITGIRVKEMNTEGEIPDSVSFLEMYETDCAGGLNVEERWLKNKIFENIRGMLGVKGGGAPVYLDVHEKYHGPHGLVAGTTGSGKSETLQTYLLSLAVNYSPDDISFFLIDYKGGGMANLFEGLPHLAGAISNLSGAQINRAMVSIKSENRRRQRLFNQAQVNNINSYTKLYKSGKVSEPLPHLFIVIDEFAELKREEPDFMKELISVAQVGRSLGVHLILSTQKPSGTVDDNIWSNSRFKLCLRVQTKEDSMEMLGKPDAAYINQAGRGYLEVGNDEIYELFQSGYSGAVYDPESAGKKMSTVIVGSTGQEEVSLTFDSSSDGEKISQLDAIISYIRDEAKRLQIGEAHRLWMPLLPNPLCLTDIEDYNSAGASFDKGAFLADPFKENGEWDVRAVIGLTDDPRNQAQEPLFFSLSEGHTAIVGNPMSGKSTLLTTIIYSLATTYSPEAINFYCIDYSGKMLLALKEFPHMGDILVDGDEVKISRLFNMLSSMLKERKKLFMGGNYQQYVRANDITVPAIILAIDNFSLFNERNGERYMPDLIRLSKEGAANGIFLIVTGAAYNMNEIPGRISANIGKAYTLALSDKFAYGDILRTVHVDVLPETAYKGRGLTMVGNSILEYQSALAIEAGDDYERLELIKEKAAQISHFWTKKRAKAVPEIPEKPTWEVFRKNENVTEALLTDNLLPIGYKSTNADIYSADIYSDYCYMITGMPRTGKKSLLRLMIYSALMKKDTKVVLIDNGNIFADIESDNVRHIISEEDLYEYCVNELTPLFRERNGKKRQLLGKGLEDDEYYAQMKEFCPVYIFISSITWFTKTVHEDSHNMQGFMETLIKKGEGHKISFIGIMDLSERSLVSGYEVFNIFSGYGRGIHLGGNCMQNPYMSFGYMSSMEQAQNLPAGIGVLPQQEVDADAARIVIPLPGKVRNLDREA